MSNPLLKIRAFVINDILKGHGSDISDDLNLAEAGLLSSLATMRLVSFVEDEFDIMVGVSDPRTRFTTICEIARYVDEKLSGVEK
ncbi:acyl carrier protein [Mycoavidus sp. SF9855]|uniref:acyl carrier protein n=1 Tax=Mycoavidus sp. SF9855 TaxID=2968475 RepID=UPI00211BA27C|nr:phosphopantetheine-binding protein [Mycoavidus sp. SF9855]UUM21452.1 phosphopantetheine-binding protein [Mycoavidus sp. SF9855]